MFIFSLYFFFYYIYFYSYISYAVNIFCLSVSLLLHLLFLSFFFIMLFSSSSSFSISYFFFFFIITFFFSSFFSSPTSSYFFHAIWCTTEAYLVLQNPSPMSMTAIKQSVPSGNLSLSMHVLVITLFAGNSEQLSSQVEP